MISFGDLRIYLPKYLSAESEKELFQELRQFPGNVDQRFYTDYLEKEDTLFQGDGLSDLLIVDMTSGKADRAPALVLSNTCDVNPGNHRYIPANVCYAPILRLSKYEKLLSDVLKVESEKRRQHIETIRKQHCTQVFFLPRGKALKEDSIVFLDRIHHCSNKDISRSSLRDRRIFTLSNYGFYVFLIKLSIHFTRVREGIDRNAPSR